MAIQDTAKEFFLDELGRTNGHLSELAAAWLAAQGHTTGSIDERWQSYLAATGGALPSESLSRYLIGPLRAGASGITLAAAVSSLFQSSEPGVFYDPSDLTSLYQEAAGLTPVTSHNDPVGLMLDKAHWDGRGVVNRFPYSGNLLTEVWATYFLTKSAGTPPSGYSASTVFAETTVTDIHAMLHSLSKLAVSATYTMWGIFKARGATQYIKLRFDDDSINNLVDANYDLVNGIVSLAANVSGTYSNPTANIEDLGDGWYICELTATTNTSINLRAVVYSLTTNSSGDEQVFTGNTANGFEVAVMQMELGASRTAYQENGVTVGGPGNHATQATSSARPVYKTEPHPDTDYSGQPELVTNGGFDTDTSGWTSYNSATLSVVSGKLRTTNSTTSSGGAYQTLTTVIGQRYKIVGDLTGTNGFLHVGTSAGSTANIGRTLVTNEAIEVFFIATATTTYITVSNNNATNGVYKEWDNISVKEVPANAQYLHWIEGDGVDDFLRATFTIAQPWDRISAIRQVSWTSGRAIFGGATALAGILQQITASPTLRLYDGTGAVNNNTGSVGSNFVVSERHAGASSELTVNNLAAVTGNPGTTSPGGVTIFGSHDGTLIGNARIYPVVMREGTLTDAQIARLRTLIGAKAGLTL